MEAEEWTGSRPGRSTICHPLRLLKSGKKSDSKPGNICYVDSRKVYESNKKLGSSQISEYQRNINQSSPRTS